MPYSDPAKNDECVRRYKLEHRDEINTRTRELRALDPERFREHSRRYRKKVDPKLYKKRKHESYLRRKKKHLIETKQWRIKHPDKAKKYHAKWIAKNPARCSLHRSTRRARLFNSTIGNLQIIERWEQSWRKKSKVKCYWCCLYYPACKCVSDHILSLSRNGSHSIENLCISCKWCNAKKHARSLVIWNGELRSPSLI